MYLRRKQSFIWDQGLCAETHLRGVRPTGTRRCLPKVIFIFLFWFFRILLTWWVFPSLDSWSDKLRVCLISKITQETRIDRRFSGILFFACREHRTTPHSLSWVLAKFHVDPCSLEASARSQRGGMRCCVKRVPISEFFPIRFPISEIRNRKLLWAFRVFVNQTVILELN
jgi:hypothetical protein